MKYKEEALILTGIEASERAKHFDFRELELRLFVHYCLIAAYT